MIQKFIETGKITGTHGIKGEVRVQPWSDSPEFLTAFTVLYTAPDGSEKIEIEGARAHKNMVLLKIRGVDTIEQAEKLRNKVLYLDRDDAVLDKETVFISDILGCEVYRSQSGELLGKLTDVFSTGANDVWQVTRNEKDYLVPAISEVIVKIDVENGRIDINPMAGIFDKPERVEGEKNGDGNEN